MSSSKFDYRKGLCAPTIIGILLAVGTIVSSPQNEIAENVLRSGVTVAILYTLCYYGYKKAAWAFLLLPLLIIVALIMAVSKMS